MKRKHPEDGEEEEEKVELNPTETPESLPEVSQRKTISRSDNWIIDYSELQMEHELGRGAFGVGKETTTQSICEKLFIVISS